jgi:6-pyruvoyl-tetrahydropterin synthase
MERLFVDDLTAIDCSVLDRERGLVGTSWIVDLELAGNLDQQGMLFDFGLIKKQIKDLIDRDIDHKLVIPVNDPGCVIQQAENSVLVEFTDAHGRYFRLKSPEDAICMIDCEKIAPGGIAAWLAAMITEALPDNVTAASIVLRQEDDQASFYHYSHGLKKHDGNCQRIAHGHRSRIEIWEDGERSPTLEKHWADKWRDIYLGTRADLVNSEADEQYRFEYRAIQGKFALELPSACVYLIDSDSTVECIARHVADEISSERPGTAIRVKTWEGVRKGAIAEAGGPAQEEDIPA